MKKEIKDDEILQDLYNKGMIDFEGDEDNLIMQVPTNIIKTGKFVVDVYKVGYQKAKQKILKEFSDRLKEEMNGVIFRYTYPQMYGKMSEVIDEIKKEMEEK